MHFQPRVSRFLRRMFPRMQKTGRESLPRRSLADQMPQSAVTPRFFTRYVKQAGALSLGSAVPWRLTTGA